MKKKPFRKSDFKAAIQDPITGKIYTGIEHYDAMKEAQEDGHYRVGMENAGFLKIDGTFYTRVETEKIYGFKTSQDLLD